MKAHELARRLLELPDLEAEVDDGAGRLAEVVSARHVRGAPGSDDAGGIVLEVDEEAWP